MSAKQMDKPGKRPTAELIEQYRPLGLKAVLAAALQIKPKPVNKTMLHNQPLLPKQST